MLFRSHLGPPNAGSIWSPGIQMLMRLSALKKLCAMNRPKKEPEEVKAEILSLSKSHCSCNSGKTIAGQKKIISQPLSVTITTHKYGQTSLSIFCLLCGEDAAIGITRPTTANKERVIMPRKNGKYKKTERIQMRLSC